MTCTDYCRDFCLDGERMVGCTCRCHFPSVPGEETRKGLSRRSFLRWFTAGAAVTVAGLLVPEAPKIAYSFLTDNPLTVIADADAPYGTYFGVRSVDAILKEAYSPMLLDLLNEDVVLWDAFKLPQAGRRVPWPGKVSWR